MSAYGFQHKAGFIFFILILCSLQHCTNPHINTVFTETTKTICTCKNMKVLHTTQKIPKKNQGKYDYSQFIFHENINK